MASVDSMEASKISLSRMVTVSVSRVPIVYESLFTSSSTIITVSVTSTKLSSLGIILIFEAVAPSTMVALPVIVKS